MQNVKYWIKNSPTPIAKLVRQSYQPVKQLELPVIPIATKLIYQLHKVSHILFTSLFRRMYWTPLFKSQIKGGKGLYLYSGMPQLLGNVSITVGKGCRWSGISTVSGRCNNQDRPCLTIGENVDIGWQTSIAVGTSVTLDNNVRMAGRAFLAGYPGHPINPYDRAKGLPDEDHQVGAIHLKENVWLGTGVSIIGGVTVGENSIIGAGSVVTHNIPANVVAAGVPAKVIRKLNPNELRIHSEDNIDTLA
ncbi:acyltransferase [Marinomonas algicola]|uniref:acyltransferase n=1 Tax=Marinomonas algicola TaxID=2773454 RepID=UPI00174901CD|nr:acyltransferase [Marinomonas algicola]